MYVKCSSVFIKIINSLNSLHNYVKDCNLLKGCRKFLGTLSCKILFYNKLAARELRRNFRVILDSYANKTSYPILCVVLWVSY